MSSLLTNTFLPLLPSSQDLRVATFKLPKSTSFYVSNCCGDYGKQQSTAVRKSDGGGVNKGLKFTGDKPVTPILDTINYPNHMKNLSIQELQQLSHEIREEIVYTVSKTGGHLSSSLGVADLTVALHHVFATPEDKIIWDVGHQVGSWADFRYIFIYIYFHLPS